MRILIALLFLTQQACSQVKWSIDQNGAAHIQIRTKTKAGFKFHGREITPEDLPYMFSLFTNPIIMKNFGNGQIRSYEVIEKQMDCWIKRIKSGNISSGIILFDEQNKRIGFIVLGNGDGPGYSELAYALMDERSIISERLAAQNLGKKMDVPSAENIWGKGIIGCATKLIMKEWLPLLVPNTKNLKTKVPAAQFVFGTPLTRIDSTTSITNLASFKILLKNGFKPALDKVQKIIIIFDSAKILNLYDPNWKNEMISFENKITAILLDTSLNLETGTRYLVMDGNIPVVTISWHPQFNILKTHWEYTLPNYELPKTALDLSKICDDTEIIANKVQFENEIKKQNTNDTL